MTLPDYMNMIDPLLCQEPEEPKEPQTITLGSLIFEKEDEHPRGSRGAGYFTETLQRYHGGKPFYFWLTSRIRQGVQTWSFDERDWHETPKEALLDKKKRTLAHCENLRRGLIEADIDFKRLEAAVALMETP